MNERIDRIKGGSATSLVLQILLKVDEVSLFPPLIKFVHYVRYKMHAIDRLITKRFIGE
jgi:hypothetical protein